MAGQQQDMDLNSREKRLVARRVQQQQLLNHLASTMMQGQASSSSGGNTEGGLEAVGHMLVNWSQGRKEAQAKKVPKFVPPPPKVAAPAAPWRQAEPAAAPTQPKTTGTPPAAAPAPWSTPGLSNDALEALQQLGEQVHQRLQEEKDEQERSWYRTAAKEEDVETEPPSCEEATAPTPAEPAEVPQEATEKAERCEEKKENSPVTAPTPAEPAEVPQEAREKAEGCEEKKENSPVEDPDWGGSNSQEPAEEKPPEKNEEGADEDSMSEGALAKMTEKELMNSLKVSYQAAFLNLEDAQKKEKLLGVSRRTSTSCMQQLQDLKKQLKRKKDKQQDVRDDPGWPEDPERRGRRKRRRHHSRGSKT